MSMSLLLKAEPLILRPYQQEAVNAVYDYLRHKDDNPCVVIPTAGGKGAIMSTICRDSIQHWNGSPKRCVTEAEWDAQMYCCAKCGAQKKTESPFAPPTETSGVEIGANLLGKKDMRLLRENLSSLDQSGPAWQSDQLPKRGQLETAAFLLHLLRQEGQERYVESQYQDEGKPEVEANRPCSAPSRGQWQTDRSTETTTKATGATLASGTCSSHPSAASQGNTNEYQDRYSQPETKDRDRTGRSFACDDQESQDRQTTDGVLASQRVVRITHIQCESPVPVFNLQVTGHPSYYANEILAHNCHMLPHDGEGMYRKFLAESKVINPQVRLIGLTATPYRMSTGLICAPENLLNEICYEISVKELIVQGYLCPLKSKAGKVKVDTSGLHIRGGEFIANEVEELMDRDSLVHAACREIVEHTRDRHSVLIFAAGVQHGRHIQRTLEKLGQECGFVCGETLPFDRAETLRRFRDSNLKYLCNVNVLTTGFDAPNIDCVAMLRPTMSAGLFYQMTGRGFRLSPDKTDCLILDFAGNVLRHGPVDDLQIKPPSEGNGVAPVKECPGCGSLIHASYTICPECDHEFPPPERRLHDHQATTAGVLTGQFTDTRFEVQDVSYCVHFKRKADLDHPPSMRVEYRLGYNNYQSEWICFEHTGYARTRAEVWWRKRSNLPVPKKVTEAIELAEDGALCKTKAITVRNIAGQKYANIIDYELGDKPSFRQPGWEDESEQQEYETASVWDDENDEIPF